VRASLDKAASKARIEAVEVLARLMDTTGRKKERAKNRHAEVAELVDAQHSGCEFSKRSKEPPMSKVEVPSTV